MKYFNRTILASVILAAFVCVSSCAINNTEDETSEATGNTAAGETVESSIAIPPEYIYNNQLFEDFESGKSICFVGDSITYGSAFEPPVPWYNPLLPFIRGEVKNFSQGGWTTTFLVSILGDLPQADIYVVAIGINDVLFRDELICAQNTEEFIDNLDAFSDAATRLSPDAKIYFIAPWPFLNQREEAYDIRQEYADAMRVWCDEEGWYFMDPSFIILDVLDDVDTSVYMWNDYHPDEPEGVGLYSYAVMLSAAGTESED